MEYTNILLIKMSSLGDVLHTLPFAAALRMRYPAAKLTWLVHPQFGGFVPDPPLIDEVIYFDKAAFTKMSWGERFSFVKKFRRTLREKHFDLVIDMQGLFKSAVVAFLTGCPERIGYAELREGSCLVSRAISGAHRYDHVIERYLDVARYLGAQVKEITFPMPSVTAEEAQVQAMLEEQSAYFREGANPPYIVIAPGARWDTKRYLVEHYAALATLLEAEGKAVVLVGGKEDRTLGDKIIALSRRRDLLLNCCGRTSLRELAALIKNCFFYISADTGPLHIATAYQKPLIALYGPTKPDRTGPYGDKEATVLVTPATCAGCLRKKCADWHCMRDITPEMVYKLYRQKVEAQHA